MDPAGLVTLELFFLASQPLHFAVKHVSRRHHGYPHVHAFCHQNTNGIYTS
jgi:hypothetical protein